MKLSTIAYGLIGTPMFIYGVYRSGDRLSLATVNVQLRIVHYGFRVPMYLLRQVFRLVICLCCCCYCCGLLALASSSFIATPCSKPKRPKLKLWEQPSSGKLSLLQNSKPTNKDSTRDTSKQRKLNQQSSEYKSIL